MADLTKTSYRPTREGEGRFMLAYTVGNRFHIQMFRRRKDADAAYYDMKKTGSGKPFQRPFDSGHPMAHVFPRKHGRGRDYGTRP